MNYKYIYRYFFTECSEYKVKPLLNFKNDKNSTEFTLLHRGWHRNLADNAMLLSSKLTCRTKKSAELIVCFVAGLHPASKALNYYTRVSALVKN